MKKSTLLFFLIISFTAFSQVDNNSDLFRVLEIQDSTLFELGFNQCNIEHLQNHISEDLRFYHDQSGFQDRDTFFENTRKYICGDSNQKPIRKVDANTLEVFPLYNNGVIYAAIQKGIHHFYLRENDKEDVWTSTAKFTHVWVLENETWKLSEVLSYDHQDPDVEHSTNETLIKK